MFDENSTPKRGGKMASKFVQTSLRSFVTVHSQRRATMAADENEMRAQNAPRSVKHAAAALSCHAQNCGSGDDLSPVSRRRRPTARRSAASLSERNLNICSTTVSSACLTVVDERVIVIDSSEDEAEVAKRLKMAPSQPTPLTPVSERLNSQNAPNSPEINTHYSLPVLANPRNGAHSAYGTIAGETLAHLLFALSREQFRRKFVLVDCRYPYEFAGGHIRSAINISEKNLIADLFFPPDERKFAEMNARIPIFYCEYSQQRGPRMALELRQEDRARNAHRYPDVHYREIYVLDQGYRKFFMDNVFMEFCEPAAYTPMIHAAHVDELKRYRHHHKRRAEPRVTRRHASNLISTVTTLPPMEWD